MRLMTAASTRQLASAPFELVSDRRSRVILRSALVAVLVCLALVAGLRIYAEASAPASRLGAAQLENATLRSELAQVRAELEFERATHAALDQQVTALNEQVSDLSSQLNFFNAQNGRSRNSGSRN
jgi:septal ring factor EnvC (AmiA/AmiB activator)